MLKKCLHLHGLYVQHLKPIMLMSFFNNHRLAVVLSATVPNLLVYIILTNTQHTRETRPMIHIPQMCTAWMIGQGNLLSNTLPLCSINQYVYILIPGVLQCPLFVFMFSSTRWEQFTSIYPVSQGQDDENHSDCKIFVSFLSCVTQLWTFSSQLRCKVILFSLLHYNL